MGTKELAAQTGNGQARCQQQTESGRQCLLAVHTDSVKHKYMNRDKVHHSLADVLPKGFTLTAIESVKGDVVKKSASRADTKPRDDEQKHVDADAKKNFAKNHGKHNASEAFEAFTHAEYIVPPRAVETVLEYLKRASGSAGGAKGATLRYRQGAHGSGNVRIQWAYVDAAPAAPPSPVAPKA